MIFDFEAIYKRLDEAQRRLDEQSQTDEDRKRILAARAFLLAQSREQAPVDTLDLVVFQVGGERYALPTPQVDQVVDLRDPTPLPKVPAHVLGMLVSRSRVVVVMDLRQLLGLEGGGMSDLAKVIVVSGEDSLGLAVEQVEGRMELLRGNDSAATVGPFLHVTDERVAVLDLERLLEAASASRAG